MGIKILSKRFYKLYFRKKTKTLLFFILMLSILPFNAANATIITTETKSFDLTAEAWADSSNFTTQPEGIGVDNITVTTHPSFSMFDPTLGTLERVFVTIDGTLNWMAIITNADTSYGFSIYANGGAGFVSSPTPTPPLNQHFGYGDGESILLTAYGNDDDTGFRTLTVAGTVEGPTSNPNGLDINPFIGTDSFTLEVGLDGGFYDFPTGDYDETQKTGYFEAAFSGNLTVGYEYTPDTPASNPVPEPATMLLLGSGLVGLLGFRRKFKK